MSNSKNGRGNPYDEYLKISGRRRNFAIEEVVRLSKYRLPYRPLITMRKYFFTHNINYDSYLLSFPPGSFSALVLNIQKILISIYYYSVIIFWRDDPLVS